MNAENAVQRNIFSLFQPLHEQLLLLTCPSPISTENVRQQRNEAKPGQSPGRYLVRLSNPLVVDSPWKLIRAQARLVEILPDLLLLQYRRSPKIQTTAEDIGRYGHHICERRPSHARRDTCFQECTGGGYSHPPAGSANGRRQHRV